LLLRVHPLHEVVQSLNTQILQFFCTAQKKTMSLVSVLKSTAPRDEKIQKIQSMMGSSLSVYMLVDLAEELIQPSSWADYLFCRTVPTSAFPTSISTYLDVDSVSSLSNLSSFSSHSSMSSMPASFSTGFDSISQSSRSAVSQTSFISITFRPVYPSYLHYSSILLEDDPQSVESSSSLNYFQLHSETVHLSRPTDFQIKSTLELRHLPPLPTSPKKYRPPFRP